MSWLTHKMLIVIVLSSILSNMVVVSQLMSLEEPVCCFNGTNHRPGNVILDIDESCVSLVCAIDESRFPATSVIVHVQKKVEECEGTPCKDCYDTSCVGDHGVLRSAGETWMPTGCLHCECTAGQVVDCKPVPVACEPQPYISCVEIPGPCCPTWNCSDQFCVDEDGRRRELGEEWGGPCVFHTCSTRGILTSTINCVRPPALNSSCELFTPDGNCCPVVSCGCVDADGEQRKLNEQWGGPCITHTCTREGVATRIVDCLPVPRLNSSCELFTPEGRCCPEIRCGCVDDQGIIRRINETWGSPCVINSCTENGISTLLIDCPPTPKLNDSCQLVYKDEECCPKINCGCVDDENISRAINETWGTPCIVSTCTVDGIFTYIRDCPRPPPVNETCTLVFKKDQCCPIISCGCVDEDGIRREIGETWEKGCTSFICTDKGNLISAPVTCNNQTLGEPEHFNCVISVAPGKCCPEWVCGPNCAVVRCAGPPHKDCVANAIPPLQCCATYTCPGNSTDCVDADGIRRTIGSTWIKGCRSFECVEQGKIIDIPLACTSIGELGRPKHSNCIIGIPTSKCCPEWICGPDCATLFCEGPPRKNCVADELPPLQCCPTYTCPTTSQGCVDAEGNYRLVGSKWERGCTSYQCLEVGNIVEGPITCSSVYDLGNPQHSNCIIGVVPGKCCPEWICGPNCAAVLCLGPTSSICIADEIPPLECCATYTCPDIGDTRPIGPCKIGATWIEDCLKHTCTAEGIETSAFRCDIYPKPSEDCTLVLPEGKCCLEWQCNSSEVIADESELVIPPLG